MSVNTASLDNLTALDGGVRVTLTPPADGDYDHTQLLYRQRFSNVYLAGETYVGSQGVQGAVDQTGLVNGVVYEFALQAVDGSGNRSAPSVSQWIRPTDGLEIAEADEHLNLAREALASGEQYQAWLGITTGTPSEKTDAALARTVLEWRDATGEVKPYVIIVHAGDQDFNPQVADNVMLASSGFLMLFLAAVPAPTVLAHDAALRAFNQATEKIIKEFVQTMATGPYLLLNSVSQADVSSVPHRKATSPEFARVYRVGVGFNQ